MATSKLTQQHHTVAGFSTKTGIILYGGFSVIGITLGYFLPQIAAWVLTLPWVPFQGPIKLIHSFNGSWLRFITTLLGLIAGVSVAYIAIKESLIATVTDEEVQLDKDGLSKAIPRKEIDTIFLDGKQLVILGISGHVLSREKLDESPKLFADAFLKHGYSWSQKGDPYKDQYRRWVLDTPDLPPAANALMKAREIALQKKEVDDAKDLLHEIDKLGFVVRDEETRQYWRVVKPRNEISK